MNPRKLRALPYVLVLLPLDILVAAGVALACAVEAIHRGISEFGNRISNARTRATSTIRDRKLELPARPARRTLATIQILNWDGKHLLEDCLPSVLEAVRAAGGDHKILVVDNGSTDGSAQFVRQRFPEVQLLELDRNYGFVGGNNRGVETITTEIVVLLNNDMVVDRGFLNPLLDGFTDESVFAVTSQIFLEDPSRHRAETGKTRAKFEKGFFYLWHEGIDASDERRSTVPVLWAGGGSCAFDREKYRQLGGLDDLYHPFYVEDTDLSYQAWKRGWKCLLAPASRVVHKHRATSSRKYALRFVENTTRRNLYLFIWKNVTSISMIVDHLLNLPRTHARAAMTGNGLFELKAYARAFVRLPRALIRRVRESRHYVVKDLEVLVRSGM